MCTLDEWSVETIARYLRTHPSAPDERLCVKADTPPTRAAESVTAQLWKVISEAGFARHRDISGRSLRLTAARRALDEAGIEAAARLLGPPSLDNVADALGYDWRQPTTSEPLGHDPKQHTAAPDTAAPDSAAPDTAAPDTAAPDTAAPVNRPGFPGGS